MRKRLPQIALVVIGGLMVIIIGLTLTARPAARHPYLTSLPNRPLVIAHQCGDQLWPGDTLYACQRAAELGVDILEMDFQVSADGQLVVIHDEIVDRTTDGTGRVESLTLAELKQLDAAYDWSPDGGQTFPYRGQGLTLATVEEVFQALPEAFMIIEIKPTRPEAAEAFCNLLRQSGRTARVMAAAFDADTLSAFRRACPEVATSASQNEMIAFFALQTLGLGNTYSPAFQAVHIPEERFNLRVLTPGFIASTHARNLEVHVWTINETDDLKRILALGVDGIMTKRPDRMLTLLDRPYTVRP